MKTTTPTHYRYLILYFIFSIAFSLHGQVMKLNQTTYHTEPYAPITNLPEFKAVFLHHNGLLTWKIEHEVNQGYYIIERSFNGVRFSKAGSVAAVNDSVIHEYRFLDYSVPNGVEVIYYRLKQKDLAGNTAISRVVVMPVAGHASAVHLYPNPVISEASISITVQKPQHVVARLADGKGMHLQTKVWEINAGSSSLAFDMSTCKPGTYILDISSGLIKKRLSVIKR